MSHFSPVQKLKSIAEEIQMMAHEIEFQDVTKKYIRYFHDEPTDRYIFQGSFNGSVWFELIQGTNAYKEFFETKNGHRFVITTESRS